MHFTPKKTINSIIDSGNHYVLQVKRNQIKLYEYIEKYIAQHQPIDTHTVTEKTHGRQTTWTIKVFSNHDITLQKTWTNLERFIAIEKRVIHKDKPNKKKVSEIITTQSISYRISDVKLSAKEFAQGIRGHWGIENRIHWVKDVNFKEDTNKIEHDNGAVNMSIFNAIAINYLRQNIDDSIKKAQILFGQNVKELISKIRT